MTYEPDITSAHPVQAIRSGQLSPVEIAAAVQQAIDSNMSLTELARQSGKDHDWLLLHLRLNQADGRVRRLCKAGVVRDIHSLIDLDDALRHEDPDSCSLMTALLDAGNPDALKDCRPH